MSDKTGPEGRLNRLEDDFWVGLRKASTEIADARKRRLAMDLFESGSVEEVSEKVDQIRRGTWLDNLMLAGAAVGGMLLGHKAQQTIDIRYGQAPITGGAGLAGVGAGLVMDRSLTARNVLGLSGMMFLAGAGLYTSTNPLDEPESEEGEGS